MTILYLLLIFLTINSNRAVLPDLSGLYDFEDCSCTVLRCLEPYLYQLKQSSNGDFVINYFSNIQAANGKSTSINNGQQTQVFIRWLPGMDFDTNCTGTWIPARRSIQLKCGDQYRYCTGQLQCRADSGACAKNSSIAAGIQYQHVLYNIFICTMFLLFISYKKTE